MRIPTLLLALPLFLAFSNVGILAQDGKTVELAAPQKTGGKPLLDTLAARATSRAFDAKAPGLTARQISDLLWATFGTNRPDGRRTAPSAMNRQDLTLYVLLETGTFIYDAGKHQLLPVLKNGKPVGDIRVLGGNQDFVKKAPLTLVYVSDFTKLGQEGKSPESNAAAREMAGVAAGAASQNASLYCASEDLLTGVRMSIPKAKLAAALDLRADQWIVLAQSVGRKAEEKK
ncbi:MAG: nitroreductase family protein [Puniceicoccales bacterium]|jgi:hypothetical protein|nr:nitroreductase family protein [Puniceicoccales bacterium]